MACGPFNISWIPMSGREFEKSGFCVCFYQFYLNDSYYLHILSYPVIHTMKAIVRGRFEDVKWISKWQKSCFCFDHQTWMLGPCIAGAPYPGTETLNLGKSLIVEGWCVFVWVKTNYSTVSLCAQGKWGT